MTPQAYKVYTLVQMERARQSTPTEAFLDAWAKVNAAQRGWTVRDARKQLDDHVKRGHFEPERFKEARTALEAFDALTTAQKVEVDQACGVAL